MTTYKLVGDNLDKNVHPRDMRSDHQTQSFHFFHTYAVRDRIDLSEFSDDERSPEVFKAEHLLPSTDNKKQIIDNYIHLYTLFTSTTVRCLTSLRWWVNIAYSVSIIMAVVM